MANNIPTPHISAKEGEIAPSILLPGDPLRAKYIAENFLAGAKQFNSTRNKKAPPGRFPDFWHSGPPGYDQHCSVWRSCGPGFPKPPPGFGSFFLFPGTFCFCSNRSFLHTFKGP